MILRATQGSVTVRHEDGDMPLVHGVKTVFPFALTPQRLADLALLGVEVVEEAPSAAPEIAEEIVQPKATPKQQLEALKDSDE